MRPTMKGYNFRFSEGEIKILDEVKEAMSKERVGFSRWNEWTRTDTIKALLRREHARICEEAEERKAKELATASTASISKTKVHAGKGNRCTPNRARSGKKLKSS